MTEPTNTIQNHRKKKKHDKIVFFYINDFVYFSQTCCMFLDGSLPCLTKLNLSLQIADPIIHVLYDLLHSTAVALINSFRKEKLSKQNKLEIVENPGNYLDVENVVLPIMSKQQLRRVFEEGDISLVQKRKFLKACLGFYKAAFIYVMFDEFLKHAGVLNILDQKRSFNSVMYLVDALKSYVSVAPAQLTDMEEESTILQSMDISDFSKEAVNEATIRIDDDRNSKVYRIGMLWYHLFNMKMPGLQTSKFKIMFSLAQVILSIVHSNAEEETLFSRVRKNLTAQRESLALDDTLSSIMTFQLNRDQGETCVISRI